MSALGAARERWLELARRAAAERAPEAPGLAALRAEALARFGESGFPDTRREEWRYTNLEPLARIPFEPAAPGARVEAEAVEAISIPFFACSAFVFVDGRLAPGLSAPLAVSRGLRAEPLAAGAPSTLGALVDTKEHPLAALQTALFEDAAVVRVPAGAQATQPLHLVFVSTGAGAPRASFPRVVVEAGAGSRSLVIQDHVTLGPGPRLTVAVTELRVAADAALELVLVQRESDATWHVGNLRAEVERDARLAVRTLTLGGALVRNDLGVLLAGPGSEVDLDGLFVGAGERLVDNHTLVDHAVPHGTSRELYKGILGDRSRGVFRGRVIVRPDAQKSDARQANANVLLSDAAEIDTKPQLEILADDVRCSHGASIGRLDPEALFYLRSRGIAEQAAREILTRGFAAEVLGRIGSESLAEALGEVMAERLREGPG